MKIARVNAPRLPALSSPAGMGGATALPALNDLTDVDTTGAADGDVIVWNDYTQTWEVGTAGSGVPDGVDPGDILAWDGSAWDVLPVGSDGDALVADSTQALGLIWEPVAFGSGDIGPGGASDPIFDVFGTPDTAFEFKTSSLSGLTAIGSPATEDANTTVPDCYYVRDATSGTAWQGRYVASPSHPFTAIIKVQGSTMRANYNGVGLFVAVATPGKMSIVDIGTKTRTVGVDVFTTPTSYGSTPASDIVNAVQFPCYLGLRTASTSSVNYYFSHDGYLWTPILLVNDPSMTIGSVGFAAKSENSGGHAAAVDFFRIWNSSKSFVGN